MFRTLYWLLDFILYLFYILGQTFRAKQLERSGKLNEKRIFTQLVGQRWSERILQKTGSTIHVKGLEHIPEKGPVLIVSNHQSYFDIPLLVKTIPLPMGFVAKLELKKLPVINRWMDLIECSYIDRKDMRQSLRAIKQAQKSLESGQSMVIFPEGTRSRKEAITAFKPGSLKLAQKSGVPILPVAISGSWQIFESTGYIQPSDISISILPLIPGEEVVDESSSDLMKRVFDNIQAELGQTGIPLNNDL